ncbi:Pentatricopeptide repeat [Dillenia turbinata]|uniref:Pentatricopeptide repeat n=1 Tax=Dillenia turbinata TaxID=194707 RepID=A0AAN8Z2A3_9MAGN
MRKRLFQVRKLTCSFKIQRLGIIMKVMSFSFPVSSSPSPTPPAYDLQLHKFSFIDRLKTCKSLEELRQIHTQIIKSNFHQTQLLYTTIISSCSVFHTSYPDYALSAFQHLLNPTIDDYNAIIRCFSNSKSNSLDGFLLYNEMLRNGLIPNNFTIPFLLKACALSRAIREGMQIHAQSIKLGLVLDVYVKNTLMRVYAVCGVIEAVRKVFDGSPQSDLVSWTTLIQGYVKMGFAQEGIQAFFDMCETNLQADEMTIVIVLSACARLGDPHLGKRIHSYLNENKLNRDVFVGNALVDMYLKCGDVELAHKVFNEMRMKNVVSWNSMISGLTQQGEYKEALSVFRKMQNIGVKPDSVTLVGVLNSCANLGVLEMGKWLHAYMDMNQIRADGFIGNALVDMYTKCGSIDEAFKVFEGMRHKDVYTFTAMIVGFAMNGQGLSALDLFSEMPKMGIKPDEVTFVGVLSACSHLGLVEEGLKHFESMSTVYNLVPQAEHYGCVVDLFGRSGLVREAEEFVRNMPVEPDEFIWGALLSSCRLHGYVELGRSVMEELIKIEPEKDGAYILMSNLYSSANRWGDALQVRKIMKQRRMKKIPGCSSIELGGVVYEFQKGDKSHPKSKEIYLLLDDITNHIKDYGHSMLANVLS